MLTDLISFTGHLVLGRCFKLRQVTIDSDNVACLLPVAGKCPHGMLRMDSDEESGKACQNNNDEPLYCCLLTSIVHHIDLKVTKV